MATYGSDFAGHEDIDANMSTREGAAGELYALAESVGRRLCTPRGALWYSRNDGFDIRSLISTAADRDDAADKIENECRKEARVRSAKCVISLVDAETWEAAITCVPKIGVPFRLTVTVDQVTVLLLNEGG